MAAQASDHGERSTELIEGSWLGATRGGGAVVWQRDGPSPTRIAELQGLAIEWGEVLAPQRVVAAVWAVCIGATVAGSAAMWCVTGHAAPAIDQVRAQHVCLCRGITCKCQAHKQNE